MLRLSIPDASRAGVMLSNLFEELEARAGIEPAHKGFAVPRVTTSPSGQCYRE